jgi:hypothetical protein
LPNTAEGFPDLDAFAARFEACRIPKSEWTHLAHLAIGMWHVQRYGADDALTRLRHGISRLNDSHGTLNTETSGYHETITRAYVRLLAQFLDASPSAMPLAERVSRLIASPLAEKEALLKFYSRELLMSPEARASWVEPDIMPLQISALVRRHT